MDIDNNKNINRGYRKLNVWQEAVEMYVFVCNVLKNFPYDLKKPASNTIDASLSIQRNIAEGYCRKSIKEYLNFLNYSLGSCGELYSTFFSFKEAGQISEADFKEFDKRHYSLENKLINLIRSIQRKETRKGWQNKL
ncbi:four helix bundle protein [Candidatus Sulfidibacterium hydrothermale]|uniref:four helix bundle protein n=1 Tax=Candidatus Sulfidibacterium hydrothermale TaxID=2875962 RepID=UPI001F0A41F4|nr:four helix bundle protein [Candidatus Sulfidibacterium hydrothermale]UBM62473.1 four helix bundle protein [Candidatus Sulfidibacterium hydrothermale]